MTAGAPPSHPLHDASRTWREANCSVDLWIELLHRLGLEPAAALGSAARLDFEGDQYTFWKVPAADLEWLYGIELVELAIWQPLVAHAEEQLARCRIVMPEVDAWWLPDTRGITYRTAHAKTSIAILELDVAGRRLRYLHNAGTWTLEGADFDGLFTEGPLPPYAELAKLERLERLPVPELVRRADELLRHHVARRPRRSPVPAQRAHLAAVLGYLRAETEAFHGYAFNTCRQLGAAFELLGSHLRWLAAHGVGGADAAAPACEEVAAAAQALQFALARLVLRRREVALGPHFDRLDAAWGDAMRALAATHG